MTKYGQLEYYCYTNDEGEIVVCCVTPSGEVGCSVLELDENANEDDVMSAILIAAAEALQELRDKGCL